MASTAALTGARPALRRGRCWLTKALVNRTAERASVPPPRGPSALSGAGGEGGRHAEAWCGGSGPAGWLSRSRFREQAWLRVWHPEARGLTPACGRVPPRASLCCLKGLRPAVAALSPSLHPGWLRVSPQLLSGSCPPALFRLKRQFSSCRWQEDMGLMFLCEQRVLHPSAAPHGSHLCPCVTACGLVNPPPPVAPAVPQFTGRPFLMGQCSGCQLGRAASGPEIQYLLPGHHLKLPFHKSLEHNLFFWSPRGCYRPDCPND